MSSNLLEEARKLTPSERLDLIGGLWDSLSEEEIPVTSEDHELLDARLTDLETNPDDQSAWSEVKTRLEQRRR